MNEQICIAVAGDEGSFSHAAGLKYATDEGITGYQLHFAISMEEVLQALDTKKADIGVMPIWNSTAGLVIQTVQAMGNAHRFELVRHMPVKIDQCLMVLPGTRRDEITFIASHPQALAQCAEFIRNDYPGVKTEEYVDTAKAARDLRDGKLERSVAVIASAVAAQIYGLEIIGENIQDGHNVTTFIVIKKIT